MLSFLSAGRFAFTQGSIQAVSLSAMPGAEFGLKAHNLGILCRAPEFARTAVPGVALLQTGDATQEDKEGTVRRAVSWLERMCKKRFGAERGSPLLLAVRSSPQESSPGRAKSVIYVGMNEGTTGALARVVSPNTAFRTYAWFLRNYAGDVCHHAFTQQKPAGMSWEEYAGILLHEICRAGLRIPSDPREQLMSAYEAVRGSMSAAEMSGGIIIQEAVVIDDDQSSGAGVYFTRLPKNGAPLGSGRIAFGGAGADVVTGDMGVELMIGSPAADKLGRFRHALERRFGDAVDLEFAFTRGALHMLQARPLAFGDPEVQVRVWQDLAKKRLIAPAEIPRRVYDLQRSLTADVHVVSDPAQLGAPLGRGKGICGPYAAMGRLIRTADIEGNGKSGGPPVILYADDPNDPRVINAVWARRVAGIVTNGGHDYSHIAIMARALNAPMLTGFDRDITPYIGRDVMLDEATGALYPADKTTGPLLTKAPQTDTTRYLGVNLEEIQSKVLRKIAGMTVRAIAMWHDNEIEESIRASKKGDFALALAHTWRAHYLHIELNKLNNRDKPFTVYTWNGQSLPDTVNTAIGVQLDNRGRFLDPSDAKRSQIRAFLAENAHMVDPMFGALKAHYGDRMRVAVSFLRHGGQYDSYEFVRVSAVVEGGDPYMFRREIFTYDHDLIEGLLLKLLGREIPKEVVSARTEARALIEQTPGTSYVEYDVVHDYHDRGVKRGTKVIGVLPPGYSI